MTLHNFIIYRDDPALFPDDMPDQAMQAYEFDEILDALETIVERDPEARDEDHFWVKCPDGAVVKVHVKVDWSPMAYARAVP